MGSLPGVEVVVVVFALFLSFNVENVICLGVHLCFHQVGKVVATDKLV